MNDFIPVFVNCWNRVTYAKAILDQIRPIPGAWPVIVDNASSWPPMQEWLKQLVRNYPEVGQFPAGGNVGNYAVWTPLPNGTDRIIDHFRDYNYYIVTDDDMDLATVPHDVLDVLRELLDTNPDVIKVGLALRIDDLPASYPLADHVRRFEAQYWDKPLHEHCHTARGIPVYDAPIDTTFAMYRMSDLHTHDGEAWRGRRALRVAGDYTCRHRPWYMGFEDFDEEMWYSLAQSTTFTQWSEHLRRYAVARGIVPLDFGPKGEATQQEEQGR